MGRIKNDRKKLCKDCEKIVLKQEHPSFTILCSRCFQRRLEWRMFLPLHLVHVPRICNFCAVINDRCQVCLSKRGNV